MVMGWFLSRLGKRVRRLNEPAPAPDCGTTNRALETAPLSDSTIRALISTHSLARRPPWTLHASCPIPTVFCYGMFIPRSNPHAADECYLTSAPFVMGYFPHIQNCFHLLRMAKTRAPNIHRARPWLDRSCLEDSQFALVAEPVIGEGGNGALHQAGRRYLEKRNEPAPARS
jgi:hypothetical protein